MMPVYSSCLTRLASDERKSCAFAVSIRMEALAIHILKEGMNGVEAAELLRREVARYEAESRGDWH